MYKIVTPHFGMDCGDTFSRCCLCLWMCAEQHQNISGIIIIIIKKSVGANKQHQKSSYGGLCDENSASLLCLTAAAALLHVHSACVLLLSENE